MYDILVPFCCFSWKYTKLYMMKKQEAEWAYTRHHPMLTKAQFMGQVSLNIKRYIHKNCENVYKLYVIKSMAWYIWFLISLCLIHLCQMAFTTLINWTSPFQFWWVVFFYIYSNFNRAFCKQTVETLLRCCALQRLIKVCTVRLWPIIRLLGLYMGESSRFQNSLTLEIQILKLAVCLQSVTISSLNGQLPKD